MLLRRPELDALAMDYDGRTLLDLAGSNLAIIRTPLAAGKLEPYAVGRGDTVLHIACRQDDVELVEMLLLSDAVDVNARTHDSNETPLVIAAQRGDLDIVDPLVDSHVDADFEVEFADPLHGAYHFSPTHSPIHGPRLRPC